MWPLLLVPGLISLFYFPVMALLTIGFGSRMADYVRDHWLPEFLRQKVPVLLIAVLFWLLALYLGFLLFRNVIMILYAPVLTFISAKTEENARPGTLPPTEAGGMIRGAVRGIGMSLLSLLLAVTGLVLACVLLIVPVIGQLIMAVLLPLWQMFLAGHGFLDPTLERRTFGVRRSLRFVWQHKRRVAGCGCGFVLLSLIPAIGWFLGPTLGVVAGTLVALELLPAERSAKTPEPAA